MKETYLKPNIQLFAKSSTPGAGDDDMEKMNGNDQAAQTDTQTTHQDGQGSNDSLPKTQEELDALINSRIKREEKKWARNAAKQSQSTASDTVNQQDDGALDTTSQAVTDNTALLEAQRELIQSRAELSAYKSGFRPEKVEYAVLLAIHEVEKSGNEVDEESITNALKKVASNNPEWKTEGEKKEKQSGFRVGAESPEERQDIVTKAETAKKRWNRFN